MTTWLDEVTQRRNMIRNLDVESALKQMPKASEEVALIALHKARYEMVSIEPELREESRTWLTERAYSRFANLPWPPEGELPE